MRQALVAAILLLALTLGGGCVGGPDIPKADPSIRGAVVNPIPEGAEVVFIVKAPEGTHLRYELVTVTADGATEWVKAKGDVYVTASIDDLETGQTVEVWFDRPVGDAFPLEAHAGTVLIVE